MTALTAGKKITDRPGNRVSHPLKADAVIHEGAMVGLDAAGWLVPAAASGVTAMAGVATVSADNTGGANGAKSIDVAKGVFLVAQTGLDRTDIETLVSVTDDATVGGAATLKAGTLVDLDARGAWVKID